MQGSQIIVLAIPIFLLLITLELLVGWARGRLSYRVNDTLASLSVGILSQISGVFTSALQVGIYAAVFAYLSLFQNEAFWTSPWGWLVAFVLYDLCYYWQHRLGHTCALFWASHVTHHHGQDYNLATALRQSSTGALTTWVFYLPMALAGVPPTVFGLVALLNLLYQFWIHTEQIGRLAWFDRVFASPSNHRVHHAVNDPYVDKNYGGFFILWDRLFGTFAPEDPNEPCIYSTRTPLNSWDPIWANAETVSALFKDSCKTQRWSDKLRIWFKPPGWRPADVAEKDPKPTFDIGQIQRFDTPMTHAMTTVAIGLFTFWFGVTILFLWNAHNFGLTQNLAAAVSITLGLWSLSTLVQQRLLAWSVALLQVAAMLLGVSTFAPQAWANASVPVLTFCALLVLVFTPTNARLPKAQWSLLWLAMVAGFVGDVLLRFDAFFVFGLVAFLLGHVAYILVFQHDAPPWPNRRVLVSCLALGALVLMGLVLGGMPTEMYGPVGVYILVITIMAAQAIGRAQVLQTWPSWLVAWGAVSFMISDIILGYNRFVSPIADGSIWVHMSYYAAQCLILLGLMHRSRSAPPAQEVIS